MGYSTTAVAVQASASNAAGGTTTATGVDCGATAGRLGGLLTLKIINGGTGPTVECAGYVESSPDNSTWYRLGPAVTGGTTASAETSGAYRVPPGSMYIRTVFTGNTAQAVTVQADLQRLDFA